MNVCMTAPAPNEVTDATPYFAEAMLNLSLHTARTRRKKNGARKDWLNLASQTAKGWRSPGEVGSGLELTSPALLTK